MAGGKSFFVERYDWLVTGLYLVAGLFFLALGAFEWQRVDVAIDAVARERGRVLFNLIELTRDWNAHHGGIYATVSEAMQPNPYLEHPRRDLRTTDGRQLTMVNPAYMTRQIAELAENISGVRFHITSLNPIRPANAADEWEAQSLEAFARDGIRERVDFVGQFPFSASEVRPVHRFMAPLIVKEACLVCHEKQGYKVGDIRGGISITMPAEDLIAVRDQRRKSSALIILASFIVISLLMHLMINRGRRHYLVLRDLAQSQEDVIAERTRELEERNVDLHKEVAERRRRESELRIAGTVFESAAEAIMVTDASNNIVRVNPAFTAITGYKPAEVLGRNPSLLKSGRHGAAFYTEMWAALEQRGHWDGEIWDRRKNGDIYVAWLSIARIDGAEGAGHYLAVFHDITKRKEAEELLRYKAHHDALTDLPNRELFNDRLHSVLNQAKRYRRGFAVLLADLDHFKEVNDTLGHAAGDQLLVEAASRLVSCVRESDTVARLGGDEFAIILSEMSVESEAEQIAERAVRLLAEPFYLDAGTPRVSCSIGIAFYPQHGQDSDQLLRNADIAMYAAKGAGRNTYRLYAAEQRGGNAQGDLI